MGRAGRAGPAAGWAVAAQVAAMAGRAPAVRSRHCLPSRCRAWRALWQEARIGVIGRCGVQQALRSSLGGTGTGLLCSRGSVAKKSSGACQNDMITYQISFA